MRALDLTLLTDLYELTMMQGYFKNPTDQVVVFDAFYRQNPCDGGYAIAAGLEQVIEYVRDLHFSPDCILLFSRSIVSQFSYFPVTFITPVFLTQWMLYLFPS